MTISNSVTVEFSPEEVFTALTSREFHEHVSEKFRASLEQFVSTPSESSVSVELTRFIPAEAMGDRLPDFAKKFIGSGAKVSQTDRWGPEGEGGSRDGSINIVIPTVKATVTGQQKLVAVAEGTRIDTNVVMKSGIPLLGSKIVQKATPFARKLIDIQAREVANYLQAK